MENKNQEKELDLLDLIKIFWNVLITYFFKPLIVVIKIGLRKWYVLFVAVVLGVLISVLVPGLIMKRHKAEVLLQNKVSASATCIQDIEGLSVMKRNRLASLLNLEEEVLENLVALKPHRVISSDSLFINYFVDERDIMNDTKKNEYKVHPSLFSLEVLSKDTASLSIFADAVLDYLNNRSSISILNERRLSSMRSELRTFKNEIEVLDSLRYIQYFTNDANQVVLGTSGETFSIKDKNQWIQSDLIGLKSRVIALEQALRNDTLAVEKLTELSIPEVYKNHPFRTAPIYAIILFLLSYVLIICNEYKDKIKEWVKK